MFTVFRARKGQGVVGQMVIFSIIMFLNVTVFVLLVAGDGGIFNQRVEPQINYEIGEVKKRSTVSATMNDYIWRDDRIPLDRYNKKLANELFSIYFSTPGDTVYFGERTVSKSDLRNDLKSYMKYKMEVYWQEGPSPVNYWMSITDEDRTDEIIVKSYEPEASDSKHVFPVALTDGKEAYVTLWTDNSDEIYGFQKLPEVGSP